VPNLAWEHFHLSLASLDHQPVALDLNCQVLSHPNHALREGAVLAVHNVVDCQIVGLARADETITGEAMLRFLATKSGLSSTATTGLLGRGRFFWIHKWRRLPLASSRFQVDGNPQHDFSILLI
jgi:hypothetical protein